MQQVVKRVQDGVVDDCGEQSLLNASISRGILAYVSRLFQGFFLSGRQTWCQVVWLATVATVTSRPGACSRWGSECKMVWLVQWQAVMVPGGVTDDMGVFHGARWWDW